MPSSYHEFGQGVSLANPLRLKNLKIFFSPLKKNAKNAALQTGLIFDGGRVMTLGLP